MKPQNPKSESEPLIDIEVECDQWLVAAPDIIQIVETAILAAFAHLDIRSNCDLVVLLCDDAEMKTLNAEFRQKDKATNVLSFPATKMMKPHLGDIALGFETCAMEAAEQNKSFKDHVTHLCLHGVLHLLGYDHQADAQAKIMEDNERAILAKLSIKDPYL